jgi:hypothetical protein
MINLIYQENIGFPIRIAFVDVKLFQLTAITTSADNQAILSVLVSHPNYRDSYLSPYNPEPPYGNEHGPFTVEKISVADYQLSNPVEFRRHVFQVIQTPDEAPPVAYETEYAAALAYTTQLPLEQCDIFAFTKLRGQDEHEFGWILEHFTEFILIDHHVQQVLVYVCGED